MQTFTQAQLIVSVIVAVIVGFSLGRLYQMAVHGWNKWKETRASVPGLRKNAMHRIGDVIKYGAFTAIVVGVLIAGAFASGMSS